ncbi:MAG: ATP-binding cassette domain-containing protein [Methanomicrobiales archaeon]|nr:ATP-binding cassette domain-containing protein [Methanomicrobiales archaeon]
MHLIETRDLSFTYPGGIKALNRINFIAPRNKRIAIIGPNGAGKSTLFKHFNGILKPTTGEVLIKGEPVTKENLKEVRKLIGLVFQNADDQIFSPTVEQDVAFGPINLGLDERTVAHRVNEALRLLGIEELRSRVPHHLSGGEKKRVAIAGILAMEPEVLVLDEPNAGLDPRSMRDLAEFIRSLTREYGMTVIFSTHDLSLVSELAEYVYLMHRGEFIGEGTVEELFEREDLLTSVRLDMPALPKLFGSLRRHGIDVPMAYTFDDAVRALLKAFGRDR